MPCPCGPPTNASGTRTRLLHRPRSLSGPRTGESPAAIARDDNPRASPCRKLAGPGHDHEACPVTDNRVARTLGDRVCSRPRKRSGILARNCCRVRAAIRSPTASRSASWNFVSLAWSSGLIPRPRRTSRRSFVGHPQTSIRCAPSAGGRHPCAAEKPADRRAPRRVTGPFVTPFNQLFIS